MARGALDDEHLRAVLPNVWMMAEWPAAHLGTEHWVQLWRRIGFVDADDDEAEPPTEPVTAHRGSSWGHRRGMSWTRDLERAEWFAQRWPDGAGLVFTAEIPPAAVLGFVGMEGGRNEAEVVVDPRLLPPIRRP